VATDRAGLSTQRKAPAIRLVGGARPSRAATAALNRAAHPEPGDVDGDEIPDDRDNCVFVKNGSQQNSDATLPGGDAQGDACDGDDDADGVPDTHPDGTRWDNCRVTPNPDQTPDDQFPEYGAACEPTDDDRDGKAHFDDNCPTVANDQSDLDGDDTGDACDGDIDGDRAVNPVDNCPTVWNREQEDRDGDGVGTLCDPDEAFVGGPGSGPGSGSKDRRPPRLVARVARRHRLAAVRAGLVVKLRCSEACGSTVELMVSRRLARRVGLRRTRVLASGSARLQAAGTTYAFVRFDRRATRKLFRMRRLSSRLVVVAVDRGGNRRSLSRRVSLIG
jgi:Thrombospondin type 3 repeat